MPSLLLACDAPCPLIEKTRQLLQKDRRSLAVIAQQYALPYYWLKSFSEGRAKNPSVNRVIYLYEKISGRKIAV